MNPTIHDIEYAVAEYFGIRRNVIVPNVYWSLFRHEVDVLVVRPSGHCVEVEIKRSMADLKKDFEKPHGHADHRIKQMYYCFPEAMLEKALPLIPETCGILTVVNYTTWYEPEKVRFRIRENRAAKNRPGAQPLTEKEVLNVMRVGVMRIWGLKKKLAK